jgi:hypothetical protein
MTNQEFREIAKASGSEDAQYAVDCAAINADDTLIEDPSANWEEIALRTLEENVSGNTQEVQDFFKSIGLKF